MKKVTLFLCIAALSLGLFTGCSSTEAQNTPHQFLGSWLGRAIPVNNSPCEPGSDGCLVPIEIVMLFTVYQDGTFIGIDSQIFGGGSHTTAHGEWELTEADSYEATFSFLQSQNDVFTGAFRNRMRATSVGPDRLEGFVNAHFFQFTDANQLVITDPGTGDFVPDPLQSVGAFTETWDGCLPENSCFGVFSFSVRRISPAIDQ